ncbi:MAG: UbiA family prenyltransferase [Hyphomicrobium sp.]
MSVVALKMARVGDPLDGAPLCVALEGALVRGNLEHEALMAAIKSRPSALLEAALRRMGGRAAYLSWLIRAAPINPAALAYNDDLVAFVRAQRAAGRRTHLATSLPRAWADSIAAHLAAFDEISVVDQSGRGDSATTLVERYGSRGYDYVGSGVADRAVADHARVVHLVGARGAPTLSLANADKTFESGVEVASGLARAMRPYQWSKNLLVFAPLAASHGLSDWSLLAAAIAAFACFSLAASSAYIFNDLLDLAADRAHPRKRNRPFASGAVSLAQGAALGVALMAASLAIAAQLSMTFTAVIVVYFALTTAYSLSLKRVALVDVYILATLYSLRLVGGAVATGVVPSVWLLAFAMFLFLALALIKRSAELANTALDDQSQIRGRGYRRDDRHVINALSAASGFGAVIVLAIYSTQPQVVELYRSPELLFLICPLLLYWLSRMTLKADRGRMHDDPILYTVRDRISLTVVALCVAIAVLAAQSSFGDMLRLQI